MASALDQALFVGPVDQVSRHALGDRHAVADDELMPLHVAIEDCHHGDEFLAPRILSCGKSLASGKVYQVIRHSGCSSSVTTNMMQGNPWVRSLTSPAANPWRDNSRSTG
jgi:hypothetical protein